LRSFGQYREQFYARSTGDLQNRNNFMSPTVQSLQIIHEELRFFIDALLLDFSGSETISAYFSQRGQHGPAVRQDLMPVLVYQALGGQECTGVMPLLAAWSLHLAACHSLDDAQDQKRYEATNNGLMALGAAYAALSQLETSEAVLLRDLLDALGRVVGLAAKAQSSEFQSREWSKTDYFRAIGGKAAAIIATGAWIGGRLATNDSETLSLLKNFGLALGMAIQIRDDCLDLAEDLTNGLYTLPVIEGLAMTGHPDYALLQQLVSQDVLSEKDVTQIIGILERMGAIEACQRIARAYQVQAAATFEIIPTLEPYFLEYVKPKA
jgi:hypothetical protein